MELNYSDSKAIDRVYVWRGNTDLFLALIKNREDRMNVAYDTQRAKVRVIIMVEDSPIYLSTLLPLLYKEIVTQTQSVMEVSVNDEHRILRMRARPKILVAQTYEEAMDLYRRYRPYLLSILSDVSYPKDGKIEDDAGFMLLSRIRDEDPDLPLLSMSTEEQNRDRVTSIPAVFLHKNSATLHSDIRKFFIQYLGFGDFVFRMPDGTQIASASNLKQMQDILASIPDESIYYHAQRNHFSSWLMARSEIMLASKLKPVKVTDFGSTEDIKTYLTELIHERRMVRQKGNITAFDPEHFDPEADFVKIGKGSLGGKARGLAFMSTQLRNNPESIQAFEDIEINVPKTVVISTEGFDAFINENELNDLSNGEYSDTQIRDMCLAARLPEWLKQYLQIYLKTARYPLAIRSSSLLEDARFQPFAGIYKTYMIPNQDPDDARRLEQLILAVKLVYASTFFQASQAFAESTSQSLEDEKMAVVIQQLTGTVLDDYFFPAICGVAQSYNYYPISHLKPEEGVAQIALGLGKTVVEGETALRFSPGSPQLMPQFSTVDDILANAQRSFYVLKMDQFPGDLSDNEDATLARLRVDKVSHKPPVRLLCSTYLPDEHRIRDGIQAQGHPVLTFASVLKYQSFPLTKILTALLQIGRKGMGCPVEMEFAANLASNENEQSNFALLQIRPMAINQHSLEVEINESEVGRAICYSNMALGNGQSNDIKDIIYVDLDAFDPAQTVKIAAQVGKVNGKLLRRERRYLLIGPGRWGSSDRWLGIPVRWDDISGVGAIVEAKAENLNADPSQGSHFFHNITSLGIGYFTTSANKDCFIDWKWLQSHPFERETAFLRHVKLNTPLTIKINGKTSQAVILP